MLASITAAVPRRDGSWAVSGTKSWISRLDEAAVFCVFFKDPADRLTAGVVDAGAAGLYRRPVTPAGLSGWAWGELHLDGVRLRRDILARPGKGMDLLREHFAHYRPLVAATALGAAAAACDSVAAHLDTRRKAGFITGPRDNALITLGRAYAQINAAMLAALTAQRLSQACDEMAELWGCAAKAHGAAVAYTAASELALLAGAPGFAADSQLAKARRDLNGLLYADGIHDSLYRTVGRTLTTGLLRPDARVPLPRVAADRQSASCPTTTPGPMIRSPGSRLPERSPSRPRPRPGTRRSGEPAAGVPAPSPHLVRRRHTGRPRRVRAARPPSRPPAPGRVPGPGQVPRLPPDGTRRAATPLSPRPRRAGPTSACRSDPPAGPARPRRGTASRPPSASVPAKRCTDPAAGAVELQRSSRESSGKTSGVPAEPPPSRPCCGIIRSPGAARWRPGDHHGWGPDLASVRPGGRGRVRRVTAPPALSSARENDSSRPGAVHLEVALSHGEYRFPVIAHSGHAILGYKRPDHALKRDPASGMMRLVRQNRISRELRMPEMCMRAADLAGRVPVIGPDQLTAGRLHFIHVPAGADTP